MFVFSSRFQDGGTYIPKSRESMELQALLRGLDSSGWPISYSQDGLSDRQSTGNFTRPVSRVSSRGPSPGYVHLQYKAVLISEVLVYQLPATPNIIGLV